MGQLSPRRAVYTGVFDPIHLGHLDIIQRASTIFDELIVGVGINPEKAPFFSIEERVELIRRVVAAVPNVTVQPFNELAVRFVRSQKARIMVRGLRTLSDMDYEFTMSLRNLHLDPQIETVFLMAKEEFSHVSSSFLRQIAIPGRRPVEVPPPAVAPPSPSGPATQAKLSLSHVEPTRRTFLASAAVAAYFANPARAVEGTRVTAWPSSAPAAAGPSWAASTPACPASRSPPSATWTRAGSRPRPRPSRPSPRSRTTRPRSRSPTSARSWTTRRSTP